MVARCQGECSKLPCWVHLWSPCKLLLYWCPSTFTIGPVMAALKRMFHVGYFFYLWTFMNILTCDAVIINSVNTTRLVLYKVCKLRDMFTTILSLCQSCYTKAFTFISARKNCLCSCIMEKNKYKHEEKLGGKLN